MTQRESNVGLVDGLKNLYREVISWPQPTAQFKRNVRICIAGMIDFFMLIELFSGGFVGQQPLIVVQSALLWSFCAAAFCSIGLYILEIEGKVFDDLPQDTTHFGRNWYTLKVMGFALACFLAATTIHVILLTRPA